MYMEIWAQTMVKNEARWLWYSVTSVIDHVDKVLLWDTGSTDESLEIEKALLNKYPNKILFKQREQKTPEDFTIVRQEMLDATKSNWFLMLDGDEIWWEDSIKKVISEINTNNDIESVVVPTINVVGDIFHRQNELAGRYKFGNKFGHYNLRAVNRNIPGLHSQGEHGVWGWADEDNKMIQDREESSVGFVDGPYLHTTFLQRGSSKGDDKNVIKRSKKLKYEFGENLPKDFFYPESLFKDRPEMILSPWGVMTNNFKFKAFFETPARQIKRKVWLGKPGY